MIKNWNRKEETMMLGEIFHFKNSLRPFAEVANAKGDDLFLDIDEMKVYTLDEIQEVEGLEFYRKDDDEDFLGVEMNGIIKWVD